MNKDKEDKQLLPAEIRRQIIRDVIEVEKEVSEEFLKFQSNDRDAYLSQAMQKIAGKYATRWQEAEKRAEKAHELVLLFEKLGDCPLVRDSIQTYLRSTALSEYREGKDKEGNV